MADLKKKPGAKKRVTDEFQEEEIFQAPSITREPTSRQAKLGSKVVLRITATGKPIPSYQWFHNGKKIVGATTDRLTIMKARRQAAGAYHCEAKNFVGKTASRACMLSFFTQRIPKLVIGPELSQIQEGKPFKLKVTSPAANELKDFKIYWIFNGMRIKGAMGPELDIAAAKKKYEGEYKAMIATGSSLETSNTAKMVLLAAGATPPDPSPEPAAAPPPQTAEPWEEFTFNPEDEENPAEPELVAPQPGAEIFGQTSPGTPGAPKPPLSQLATQDLIREVAAEGGVSELIEEMPDEDPSNLIRAAEADPLVDLTDDPSGFIAALADSPPSETPRPPAPVVGKLPGATPTQEKPRAVLSALPASPRPRPQLQKKKEFLEKMLTRFQQNRAPRKNAA